jgi:hypothetical protein
VTKMGSNRCNFCLDRECISRMAKGGVVSILASFCVWTKSLVSVKMFVNRDSTIQSTLRRLCTAKISVPCQPSRRSSHPVRTPF